MKGRVHSGGCLVFVVVAVVVGAAFCGFEDSAHDEALPDDAGGEYYGECQGVLAEIVDSGYQEGGSHKAGDEYHDEALEPDGEEGGDAGYGEDDGGGVGIEDEGYVVHVCIHFGGDASDEGAEEKAEASEEEIGGGAQHENGSEAADGAAADGDVEAGVAVDLEDDVEDFADEEAKRGPQADAEQPGAESEYEPAEQQKCEAEDGEHEFGF